MERWPFDPRRILGFAGILILILMVIDFNARLEELNLLQRHAAIVSTQATQVMQTSLALQTRVAYAGSDQAVQDWARGEGHYIQPGDQPVVPVAGPGATPIVIASPTPVPTLMPNWQIWWTLFFGQ